MCVDSIFLFLSLQDESIDVVVGHAFVNAVIQSSWFYRDHLFFLLHVIELAIVEFRKPDFIMFLQVVDA